MKATDVSRMAVDGPSSERVRDRLYAAVPKHPFPMVTTFRDCFLVNFSMAPETLARVLPPPIEPDLYSGRAFLSIVIATMDRMRPAFIPERLGLSYRQVVYRAVVRCQGERGVHFLRSDADSPFMAFGGNLLSFFRFHVSRIRMMRGAGLHHVDLVAAPRDRADIHATFDLRRPDAGLPATSAFPTLADAQRFLVELYAAFSPGPGHDELSTVRIARGAWQITPVESRRGTYDYLDGSAAFAAGSTRLDSVLYVRDIPYRWHRLERRRLNEPGTSQVVT